MELYAAYGSNMNPAQMAERCPHSPRHSTGWLEGWRLTFGGEDIGWEGALATVVEDADNRRHGHLPVHPRNLMRAAALLRVIVHEAGQR